MQFASQKIALNTSWFIIYLCVALSRVMPFLVTIIGILRDWAGRPKRPGPHLNIRHSHDVWTESNGSDEDRRSYIRLITGAQLASLANLRYSRIGGSYHVRLWNHGSGLRVLQINAIRSSCQAEPSQADSSDPGALPIQVARVISKWAKLFCPAVWEFLIRDGRCSWFWQYA